MKINTMIHALHRMRRTEELYQSAETTEAIDHLIELLFELDQQATRRVACFYQEQGAQIAREARMMAYEGHIEDAVHQQRRAAACYAIARRCMNIA